MHRDESRPCTSSSLYWQSCPFCDETQEQFLLSVLHEMEQNMFTEAEHTIALRGVSIPPFAAKVILRALKHLPAQ